VDDRETFLEKNMMQRRRKEGSGGFRILIPPGGRCNGRCDFAPDVKLHTKAQRADCLFVLEK
jgi:hypothetical protein